MEFGFHFPRMSAATNAAPKGLISRLKWLVDRHSDFAENIQGEDGVEVRRNYAGGITISGVGMSQSKWSGYLWYLGVETQVLDIAADDPTGIYLKVKLADGTTSYVDEIGTDTDEYNYYCIATRSGEYPDYVYALNGRTVGDIRIDLVPHMCGEAL